MSKPRPVAELARERSGQWAVRIKLPDGSLNWARIGSNQKIIYDKPERVPTHLRSRIVPRLIDEAKLRNLRGE